MLFLDKTFYKTDAIKQSSNTLYIDCNYSIPWILVTTNSMKNY